jgi:uncharacterized protein (TIGR03083 family)
MCAPESLRTSLHEAARAFVALVDLVPGTDWERPGLGVWTVRELVGHTCRALSTIETYLATPAEGGMLPNLAAYFSAAAAMGAAASEAITERGREAGRALGPDPHATVAATADRVLSLVDSTPDDTVLGIRFGAMRLIDYIPTRVFELVVHSLDLQRALDLAWTVPPAPLAVSLRVATDVVVARGSGPDVLLALTGRRPLPEGFSLVV